MPKEILDRFAIVKNETDERDIDAMSMTIHLDEHINTAYQAGEEYESSLSNGELYAFITTRGVTTYPLP